MTCAKTAEPIKMPFGMWTGVAQETIIKWRSSFPHVKGSFEGKSGASRGHVWCPIYSKLLSRRQHRYGADDDLGVLDAGAHWRHLVNMVEPSVSGGDAALCKITLTTCCYPSDNVKALNRL